MKPLNHCNLKEVWQGSFQTEIQTRMWNGKAFSYGQKQIPKTEENPVLQQVMQGCCGGSMLDVGCGSWLFSIALAPFFQHIVGLDISENMLGFAQKKVKQHNLDNCEFLCGNWAELDLQKAGWLHAFDLVFAHMTPAVFSYETFDKLVQASRKRCIFVANARRKNKVLDECLKYAQIFDLENERDRQIPYIFQYLWENGYSPRVDFREENWKSVYTAKDMTAWCLDRARLYKKISFEEEKAMTAFIHGLAEQNNGNIQEEISVTVVSFDWLVSNK